MCIFHKWAKWYQYERTIPERQLTKNYGLCAIIEMRQRKTCLKCGKAKDVLVSKKYI